MAHASKCILVINCGSSSLKFGLFRSSDMALLHEGLASSLNSAQPELKIKNRVTQSSVTRPCQNHGDALTEILHYLAADFDLNQTLLGVGHRIVHGGEHFQASIQINDAVLAQIEACVPLAPLHNPANIEGIRLCSEQLPDIPQVAVFDTAFHQTMPARAYVYALPYALYRELGVRRYGFHGSSHRFVAREAESFLGLESGSGNFISAHLGNGASICAIKNGQSVDTSMGMTPLEGLVMGTRSGDIDPGIFDHLIRNGHSADAINSMLNRDSGLKGISGLSNDMRTVVEHADSGNNQCQLAVDIFCYRLAKYVGAMLVSLNRLDALIFTGGIGENAATIREQTVSHLSLLGLRIDSQQNKEIKGRSPCAIHQQASLPILVIQTDEEKMIAEDTLSIITQEAQTDE